MAIDGKVRILDTGLGVRLVKNSTTRVVRFIIMVGILAALVVAVAAFGPTGPTGPGPETPSPSEDRPHPELPLGSDWTYSLSDSITDMPTDGGSSDEPIEETP